MPSLKSKNSKIKRISKFALNNRGGDDYDPFDEFMRMKEYELETNNQMSKIATKIKQQIEILLSFMKKQELKGILRTLLCNGRLVFELIVTQCQINLDYAITYEALESQVVVITSVVTSTSGFDLGFVISCFMVGAAVLLPVGIVVTFLLRSISQQIANNEQIELMLAGLNQAVANPEFLENARANFRIMIIDKTSNPNPNHIPLLKHEFNNQVNLNLNEFIEQRSSLREFISSTLEKKFDLYKNPTDAQLDKFIEKSSKMTRLIEETSKIIEKN